MLSFDRNIEPLLFRAAGQKGSNNMGNVPTFLLFVMQGVFAIVPLIVDRK
jgi:hypothetical protein